MGSELLLRTLLAVAITGVGVGAYSIANRIAVKRSAQKYRGLENFRRGIPAVLYLTTPTCAPCKTIQRPALQRVKQDLANELQIIEIDASVRTDLANYWGVLSVPTTFIIDPFGRPRKINHGVVSANQLHHQLNKIVEKSM